MSDILLLSATKLEHDVTNVLGTDVHITGVGKINAAMNTTKLIHIHHPRMIVNFGSCGSGGNKHEIGELLKIKWCYNDIDCRPFAGYGWTPFENNLGVIQLDTPDGDTSCFTSDTFYEKNSIQYSNMYMDTLDIVDVVDMELYAIAQVCRHYNIPLYSYKWVSDDGNPDDWLENSKIGFQNFKDLFSKNHFPIPKKK